MHIEWQAFDIEGKQGNIGRFGEVNMMVLPLSDDRWVALVSVQLSANETQSEQSIVKGREMAKYTALELAGDLLVTLRRRQVTVAQTAYVVGE
jgi:hypothetical protein